MTAPFTRATLTAALEAEATLSDWTVYGEPPEQLAAGGSLVVAPRSPYLDWSTFSRTSTALTISLIVPRTHGPAMDRIDAGLAALRTYLIGLEDIEIGSTASVGLLDDVGAIKYVVASLDVTCT